MAQSNYCNVRKSVATCMALCLLAMGGAAQDELTVEELVGLDLDALMKLRVTSVSKTNESIHDAPAMITVFTREDLERIRPRTLGDLLGYTPGFLMAREDDDYTLGTRGVVTDNNQSYLIAIDGHRVNNGNNYGFNPFNFVRSLIANAERIEIIRGPGGVFWGPDALLGLVNVITRKPRAQGAAYELGVFGGKNQLAGGYALSQRKTAEDLMFSLYVDAIRCDGEPIELVSADSGGRWPSTFEGVDLLDRYESPSINVMARLSHKDFWAAGQILHQKKFLPGWISPSMEDFTQLFFEAGQNFAVHENHGLSAKLYADNANALRRPVSTYEKAALSFDWPELRLGGELLWNGLWSDKISSIAGWDSRYYWYQGGVLGLADKDFYDDGTSAYNLYGTALPDTLITSSGDTIETRDVVNADLAGAQTPVFPHTAAAAQGGYFANGVFGQISFKIPDRLTVNAGARLDIFSDRFRPIISPRASATWYFNEYWNIKGIFAMAALRPSWTQLYGFFSMVENDNRNDLLAPERIRSIELALSGKINQKFTSSLNVFHQTVLDKINLVTPKQGTVYKGKNLDAYGAGFYNYANYLTIGAESDNKVFVNRYVSGFANLTYYFKVIRDEHFEVGNSTGAGEVVASGEPELGLVYGDGHPFSVPDYFLSAGITGSIPLGERFSVQLTPLVRYQGDTRFHAVKTVAEGRVGYEWVDDLLLVDLKGSINGEVWSVPVELGVNIHNLFNETKIVGFSSGAQAAMHHQGIVYEGSLKVTF